jgi:DNA-binding NarL/FixJ family response regulator
VDGLRDAMNSGADGFLMKDVSPEALIQSLQLIMLNRVQFETRRFQFRSLPSGRPWKVGTTGFKLDAV